MIGIVNPGAGEQGELTRLFRDAGIDVKVGPPTSFSHEDLSIIVACTEEGLTGVTNAGLSVPIVPFKLPSIPGFTIQSLEESVHQFLTGDYATQFFPVFNVELSGELVGCAVFDVMVMTDEPTTIAEYRVTSGTVTEQFRADGVVVATPLGSHDYARAAGGPLVASGSEIGVIVPVAEFSIQSDTWVFPLDRSTRITSVREDPVTTLQLDGQVIQTISANEPITIVSGADLEVVIPD